MFDICCLQDKCTAHSFLSLCPSHSSSLSLSLSCRRLTALSCKSIANQSNKEPQQICLRRTRRRGRIDWWSWGGLGLGLGLGLAKWSTVDLTKLWLNCCNPNLSTEHSNSISLSYSFCSSLSPLELVIYLFRIAVMTFSTDWILCWLQIKIATFSSDIDNNAFEHYLLCCCPLAPNSHFHSLPPLSAFLSPSLSQSVHLVHSLPKC